MDLWSSALPQPISNVRMINLSSTAQPLPTTSAYASTFRFSTVCETLNHLSRTTGNDSRLRSIKNLFSCWQDEVRSLPPFNPIQDEVFFPLLRLLVPDKDEARGTYHIKEQTLSDIFIDALHLGAENPNAKALKNWKNPPPSFKAYSGDYARVVKAVMHNRCQAEPKVSVAQVNKYLDRLVSAEEDNRTVVVEMINSMTDDEIMWTVRIIFKNLKCGCSSATFFKAFHPEADRLHKTHAQLKRVAWDLRDPNSSVESIAITLLKSVSPMLAARVKQTHEIVEKMNGHFMVETKYDGFRMQLHVDGGSVRFYSRNRKDFTSEYAVGGFEQLLLEALDAKSCILDGELVTFNDIENKIDKFGSIVTVAKAAKKGEECQSHLFYIAFDLLLVDGLSIVQQPLYQRHARLEKLLKPKKNWVELAPFVLGHSTECITRQLSIAVENGQEGIIIKNRESQYIPGDRKACNWVKLKPDYGERAKDIDLVVMGACYGDGQRAGRFSTFVCGVVADKGAKELEILSFCRVGSGYSADDLSVIMKKNWQGGPWPSCLKFVGGAKDRPDAWIHPKDAFVFTVNAADIVQTETTDKHHYIVPLTLRFPRIHSLRWDKPVADCLTRSEVDDLFNTSKGGHLASSVQPTRKKARKAPVQSAAAEIAPQFRAPDVSGIRAIGSCFKDVNFVLFPTLGEFVNGRHPEPGQKHLTRTNIGRLIAEHGGKIQHIPQSSTNYIIADHKDEARTSNQCRYKQYDVVHSSFVNESAQLGQLVPLERRHVMSATRHTAELLDTREDRYGDSFTKPVTAADMKRLLECVGSDSLEALVSIGGSEYGGIVAIDRQMQPPGRDLRRVSLFRGCVAYVDNKAIVGDPSTLIQDSPLSLPAMRFMHCGGRVADDPDGVTHVLADPNDLSRVAEIKSQVINAEWVYACAPLDGEAMMLEKEGWAISV